MYAPYRDNVEYNKKELPKREELFKNKKWLKLDTTIEYEQQQRNRKKDRIILKRKQEIQKANNINQSLQQQLQQSETQNILKNNGLIEEGTGDINEHFLKQNLNKILYGDYDDTDDIKKRIKLCIKEVKNGRFKKGDQALNDGVIVDLFINKI